jgi:hypothetical protein
MDENTRFRRALKNPLVMGGLCILAGLALYLNVIESTMNSTLSDSANSAPLPLAPAQVFSASSIPQVHDDVATRWIENPKRDPFAPMSNRTWARPTSNQAETTSPNMDEKRSWPLKPLELKAIAMEAQQRSAVINRSVVHEGEMIEGYRVVSIELQGVWLQRHGKKHLLAFANAQPL